MADLFTDCNDVYLMNADTKSPKREVAKIRFVFGPHAVCHAFTDKDDI